MVGASGGASPGVRLGDSAPDFMLPAVGGGDFILDPSGIVRFASVTQRAHDRPPVDELIRCLQTIVPPRAGARP